MVNSHLSYSQHFETLIALVTHLAVSGEGEADAANAPKLADRLGLHEEEVITVLDGFKGIFRRTQEKYQTSNYGLQYKYTLQLRYARRKYVDGKVVNVGAAITNEELFSLLEFITNKVGEEQENERLSRSNRVTLIGVWIAAVMSFLSALVTLLK